MANPDAPELGDEQIAMLARVLHAWAERHPLPKLPVIGFGAGSALSPLQLADAVSERTDNGMAFVRIVRFGMERLSFDDILRSFGTEPGMEPKI